MTTFVETFAGDVTAVTFTGSGANLTNIPTSALSALTANYALETNGSGQIVAVQYLPNTKGGTGIDSSSLTGVAKIAAGAWSASTIVNADINASAAIAFSKMESLTASSIVVTDGSGVITTTASPLSLAQGGTGKDFSSTAQFRIVATNTAANALDTTLTYGTSAVANSLVQRNGAGIVALGSIEVDTITSTGDITFSPVGGDIFFTTIITHWTPTGIAGSDSYRKVGSAQTTAATPTPIVTVATASGANGTAYCIRGHISSGTAAGATAAFSFLVKAKNIGGTLTVSSPTQLSATRDTGLAASTITITVTGTTLNINAVGIAATNINWMTMLDVISQEF